MFDHRKRCNTHARALLIRGALLQEPQLPSWFARQFSIANPQAATTSNRIAIRALLIDQPHLLPVVHSMHLTNNEILLRGIAEHLATDFAKAIGCKLAATADGWLIYTDQTQVSRFLRLVG